MLGLSNLSIPFQASLSEAWRPLRVELHDSLQVMQADWSVCRCSGMRNDIVHLVSFCPIRKVFQFEQNSHKQKKRKKEKEPICMICMFTFCCNRSTQPLGAAIIHNIQQP